MNENPVLDTLLEYAIALLVFALFGLVWCLLEELGLHSRALGPLLLVAALASARSLWRHLHTPPPADREGGR